MIIRAQIDIWGAMGREQKGKDLASFVAPSLTNNREENSLKKELQDAEKDTKSE